MAQETKPNVTRAPQPGFQNERERYRIEFLDSGQFFWIRRNYKWNRRPPPKGRKSQ